MGLYILLPVHAQPTHGVQERLPTIRTTQLDPSLAQDVRDVAGINKHKHSMGFCAHSTNCPRHLAFQTNFRPKRRCPKNDLGRGRTSY